MNLGAIQAFLLQIARIAMGAAGVWELLQPGGNQTVGWGLVTASGVAVAIDVAKVSGQVKAAAAQATAAASTTTTATVQQPAGAPAPQIQVVAAPSAGEAPRDPAGPFLYAVAVATMAVIGAAVTLAACAFYAWVETWWK